MAPPTPDRRSPSRRRRARHSGPRDRGLGTESRRTAGRPRRPGRWVARWAARGSASCWCCCRCAAPPRQPGTPLRVRRRTARLPSLAPWRACGGAHPTSRAGPAAARARASSTSTRRRRGCRAEDASGSRTWSSRRPGRTCGSARGRTATSRRSAPTTPAGGSTSTTPTGGPGATRRSSTRMLEFGKALSKAREQVLGRPRRRGDAAGAGLRGRRTAARPRLLPDRQRRVRRGERQLRPDHARAAARAPRRARRWSSTSSASPGSSTGSRSTTRRRSRRSR